MKTVKEGFVASVLASVLVVSTLMLLGVLMVIELWNFDLTRYELYHRGEQSRANVESGFLLYAADSMLLNRLEADSSVLLFEGDEFSRVFYERERWGMYEVVSVRNGKRKSTRLMGKEMESCYGATLYVPEDDRAFSLTGATFVEGDVYLSRNGVSYTQVRSEFFSGKPLEEKRIKRSDRGFPELNAEGREMVEALFAGGGEREWLENGIVLEVDFDKPALWMSVGEYLSGVRVEGHVVLCAPGTVFVEQDNSLDGIILVGERVEFADGFSGCVQVFARDSILLGDRVCLKAGSGLHLWREEEKGGYVRVGEHCEVNGYVIVKADASEGERKRAVYYQPESSRVRGLVFVDGIAEVHGTVTGSLYAQGCYYFAPEGYYSDILYHAVLPGNPGLAYPLFMAGPYERRTVKWLD